MHFELRDRHEPLMGQGQNVRFGSPMFPFYGPGTESLVSRTLVVEHWNMAVEHLTGKAELNERENGSMPL